jgi:F-type H+-transporting ATPase subunit g
MSPQSVLSSIRNVNTQQLATVGVIGAEILGFFTVGTMIGRMKLIGYHGEVHHEH